MVAKEEGRARLQTNGRDICKFLTESAHEGRTFFNKENELALDPKFEKIRNWSTKLEIKDYLLTNLFSTKVDSGVILVSHVNI